MEILEWGGGPRVLTRTSNETVPRGIKDTNGQGLSPASRQETVQTLARSLRKHPDNLHDYFLGSPDSLGCWSLSMTQSPIGATPRHEDTPSALSLSVSWTPIPFDHRVAPGSVLVDLDWLGSLGTPQVRLESIKETEDKFLDTIEGIRTRMKTRPKNPYPNEVPTKSVLPEANRKEEDVVENEAEKADVGKQIEPEEQVLCFDYLFYSSWKDVRIVSFGVRIHTKRTLTVEI